MRHLIVAPLVALALLGACATSPSTDLYASDLLLSQMEKLATDYAKSPVADPAVVKEIKALDNQAYAALQAGNSAEAQLALAGLQGLLAKNGVK